MKYLKHLLMCDTCIFESKIENSNVGDVVSLPNIETLEGLPGIFLEADSLEKLSNLRRLRISKISGEQILVMAGTARILEKLQELQLTSIDMKKKKKDNEDMDNEDMRLNMSHYDHLAKLHLQFLFSLQLRLKKVEFPPNLIDLTISNTFFCKDPMKVLKKLPRLEILRLENCDYSLSITLDFSGANSFPVLQVLAIEQSAMREFPELIVDQTGMPMLDKFICDNACLNVLERLRNIMVKP
ncbi:Hypothetical predicted protein [Olea europaea subsp. europaea]|uniref:Disease resistance R13L4/SHOC-2-like LRR domain-containing protein n=1 Tax=Olea europaea subsp. europaea TaxID=158383 RepID=A0A8S0RWV5_OLEEU|nr:Hypothetical predicted protein [Olea europaea subsp. europaea]